MYVWNPKRANLQKQRSDLWLRELGVGWVMETGKEDVKLFMFIDEDLVRRKPESFHIKIVK